MLTKDRPLLIFISLAFAFCWFWAGIIQISSIDYGTPVATIIVALGCMSAPALSAWIVTRYVLKAPLKSLGVNWRTANKPLVFSSALWLAVWAASFFLVLWLGSLVLDAKVFGRVDFSHEGLLNRIEDLTQGQFDPEKLPIPSVPVVISLILLSSVIAGFSINLLFALGEEIGWRGFMYNRLERVPATNRIVITGLVWGFWHAPLILQGHNYPEHPEFGVLMMVVFCVALAFPMDWLRRNSNSVLAPAAFHGMINASAAGLMMFVYPGHEFLGSVVGLAGILALLPVYLLQSAISRPSGG